MIGKAKINGFELAQDSFGLLFKLPNRELIKACEKGDSSIPDNVLKQFIILKMLVEQGLAETLHNGFAIESNNAVYLDDITRETLKLPSAWPGFFNSVIHGLTTTSSFNVDIELIRNSGNKVAHYEIHEPFIYITDTEYYLPSPEQWQALKAVKKHKESKHDEYSNLLVIYNLKQSIDKGYKIDLHHFSSFKLIKPDKVSVTGEILPTGDSVLNPYFGENLDFDDVTSRLGQLDKEGKVQSLRIGDAFVLLDEVKLKTVHEIINKRKINKNNLQEFLDHPSKFLDATLVDLDLGFSYRVHGATVFKHSYFGETDKKDISWFEEIIEQEKILQPSYIKKLTQSEEELERVATEIRVAINKGATVFTIGDNVIDISNRQLVERALAEANTKSIKDKNNLNINNDKKPNEPTVVDVDLNDTEATFGGDNFHSKLEDILFKNQLDFSYLSRKPFPHQETGIRWFIGLSMEGIEKDPKDTVCGGILADDMGLGKTYTALVGISEYFKICKEKGIIERPVLIVAPKSLIDVWRDEIDKTFTHHPFKDMITLHGATLNKFKQEGSSHETKQPVDNITFSLKVGKPFAAQRLDMPNRLVLTTYETLRNYQFSLCNIDWSVAIFDEAQQIKNPNTITTRAAKGLKACFKLAVTGTPVENSLADFWCLMDTVRPKALGNYQNFRKIFIQPILKAKEEEKAVIRESIGKKLRQCAGALMLRRMKENKLKGLPKKIVFSGIDDGINQYQEFLQKTMNGKQLQRYNGIMNLILELRRSGKRGTVLSGLAQLKSICLHPRLDKGEVLEVPNSRVDAELSLKESGKLEILLDILDKAKKNSEKVIIFLINKRLQSHLKLALDKIYNLQINIINGDTKTVSKRAEKTRKGMIDAFQKSDGFNIIIMSPIAAGVGLTITEANIVVHLERHWNPAKEAQATDRVYRIGQKKDVKVYLPILKHPSKDSFDVNLHKLLLVKSDLKDAVVTPEEVNPDSLFASTIDSSYDVSKSIRGKDLDDLDPREFEALCAVLFEKKLNGEGILTPQSNDYAADAYVINGAENVLIECKHKQDGGKYNSIDPITRFYFAKKHYEEETGKTFGKLILASNASSYSFRVKREAKKNGISLYTKEDLDKILSKNPTTQIDIERKLMSCIK